MKNKSLVFAVVMMGIGLRQVRGSDPFPTPPGSPPLPAAQLNPPPVSPPATAVAPVTPVAAVPVLATPPAPLVQVPAGPPASVVHGTVAPDAGISSGSTTTPAPATPPGTASTTAAPAALSGPGAVEEKVLAVSASPLFALPVTPGAQEQKDLYAKSGEAEVKAQEAFVALEKIKSDRMNAYFAFDAELDAVYDACGLTKGDAATQLSEVQDYVAENIESKSADDTKAAALVTERKTVVAKLDAAMKELDAKEKDILTAIKSMSDYIAGLDSAMVDMSSQRSQLDDVLEPSAAATIYKDIQASCDKIMAAQTTIVGASGQAKAVDDAIEAGKKQIAAAQAILDDLKKKSIDLRAIVKRLPRVAKEPSASTAEAVEHPAVSVADAEKPDEDEAKKKTGERRSVTPPLQKMVRGTVFEAPYEVFSSIFAALADFCAPLITSVQYGYGALSDWLKHVFGLNDPLELPAVTSEKVHNDPVLERIEHERKQSYEKVQDLIAQREVIEMKEALLDRLEAERVMQLDTKEKLKEEITRAYERKERELSWFELLKRVAWKSYATVRRVVIKTAAWWQGEKKGRKRAYDAGRGEEKKEPAAAAPQA